MTGKDSIMSDAEKATNDLVKAATALADLSASGGSRALPIVTEEHPFIYLMISAKTAICGLMRNKQNFGWWENL